MPLFANSAGNSQKTIIPAGQYACRCYSIIDLGTHAGEYMGTPNRKRLVRFTFEFPDCLHTFDEKKGQQPLVLGREYTLSFGDKSNLRKLVQDWLGKKFSDDEAKEFDVFSLLGKTLFTNVLHNEGKDGNTYANMSTVMPLPKGMTCGEPMNDPVIYNVYEHDEIVWNKLPKFVQEKIQKSEERSMGGEKSIHDFDPFNEDSRFKIEDVPFN